MEGKPKNSKHQTKTKRLNSLSCLPLILVKVHLQILFSFFLKKGKNYEKMEKKLTNSVVFKWRVPLQVPSWHHLNRFHLLEMVFVFGWESKKRLVCDRALRETSCDSGSSFAHLFSILGNREQVQRSDEVDVLRLFKLRNAAFTTEHVSWIGKSLERNPQLEKTGPDRRFFEKSCGLPIRIFVFLIFVMFRPRKMICHLLFCFSKSWTSLETCSRAVIEAPRLVRL